LSMSTKRQIALDRRLSPADLNLNSALFVAAKGL
jgi:hypothetical protein